MISNITIAGIDLKTQNEFLEFMKRNETTETKKPIPIISNYIVNGNAVVVFFIDGSKEIVKCAEDDVFDLEIAIEKCILQKVYGKDVKLQIRKAIKSVDRGKALAIKVAEEKKAEREQWERKVKKNYEKRIRLEAKRQLEIEEAKRIIKDTGKGKK